jgi:ribonuclease HI
VDPADLLTRLRRLSQARPGEGVLHLPARLTPQEAVEAVRAALKLLQTRTVARPQPRAPRGRIRIHIDGAARGNPGPAGLGVLIIGPDGQVVERNHRYIGEATNNVAEYRALLLALERAEALGCTDLEVYADSELLVRQLQGVYQVKHPSLRTLYTAARERIERFRRFEIRHVFREENGDADALANHAIDEAMRSGRRGARPDADDHPTGVDG